MITTRQYSSSGSHHNSGKKRLEKGLTIVFIWAWALALFAFLDITDTPEVIEDILRPSYYNFNSHLGDLINDTSMVRDSTFSNFIEYFAVHYLIFKKSNRKVLIRENHEDIYSFQDYADLDNVFISSNDSGEKQIIKRIKYLLENIKAESYIEKRYLNLQSFIKAQSKEGSSDKIVKNILSFLNKNLLFINRTCLVLSILFITIGALIAFESGTWQQQIIKNIIDKLYGAAPYISMLSIIALGLYQSIIVGILGGLLYCPIGITLSSIIPILLYQSINLWGNWSAEESTIPNRWLYFLPLLVYLGGHIGAEIFFRTWSDDFTIKVLQEHFVWSYYIMLTLSIVLGLFSIFIRQPYQAQLAIAKEV